MHCDQAQPCHQGKSIHIKEDVSLGLELAEVACVGEPLKGGVEEISGERGHHAAEEDLPGQRQGPEG